MIGLVVSASKWLAGWGLVFVLLAMGFIRAEEDGWPNDLDGLFVLGMMGAAMLSTGVAMWVRARALLPKAPPDAGVDDYR